MTNDAALRSLDFNSPRPPLKVTIWKRYGDELAVFCLGDRPIDAMVCDGSPALYCPNPQ
jgi:hypothetical protein